MRRWFDSGLGYSAELDRRWAVALHQRAARPAWLCLMRLFSRLGDGPMWAAVLVALPLAGGAHGMQCAVRLAAAGAVNLAIYWAIKGWTRRSRPCQQCPDIRACLPVPDRFSFPSGHSLHAATFALLLGASYPLLAPLLWCCAVLVAVARVVLGLHYPSDVLVGGLMGMLTGALAWLWL